MVGRGELITPGMERVLKQQIVRFGSDDEHAKQQAVAATRAIGLGRFLEVAVRRVTHGSPDRDFNDQAWALLRAAEKPSPKPATVAAR
jgi:hypothetical protein